MSIWEPVCPPVWEAWGQRFRAGGVYTLWGQFISYKLVNWVILVKFSIPFDAALISWCGFVKECNAHVQSVVMSIAVIVLS